ncbi:uncharacterized protein LOC124373249 [Homalodisca vitripennis]|nr:uncharacterized protein LOC124373249 [Homalodisca vitripennis]
MGRIKSNFWADTPSEWANYVREARQNPSPFVVEEIDYTFWMEWKEFLELTYKKKIPVLIRPMREIKVTCSSERLIYFRNNYSGHWDSVAITLPKRKRFVVDKTTLPDVSLKDRLSISNEKYQDVMELTKFCKNLTAREYFENLPHCTKEKKKAK